MSANIAAAKKRSDERAAFEAAQRAATQSAPTAPQMPDPDDQHNKNNDYYKRGLKEVPDDWVEVESERLNIKSDAFKNFLRENGFNPKSWWKIVEKWAAPDGTIYQRHYWTNGTDVFYHGDGIVEFYPH